MPKVSKAKKSSSQRSLSSEPYANAKPKPANQPAETMKRLDESPQAAETKAKESTITEDGTTAEESTGISTKTNAVTKNYLLRVRLRCSSNPMPTRIISVSSTLTFEGLHRAIEVVFSWTPCYLYAFRVMKISSADETDGGPAHASDQLLRIARYPVHQRNKVFQAPFKRSDETTLADFFEDEAYTDKVKLQHGEAAGMREALKLPTDSNVVCVGGEGHSCTDNSASSGGSDGLKWLFFHNPVRIGTRPSFWESEGCWCEDHEDLDPYEWDMSGINNALEYHSTTLGGF